MIQSHLKKLFQGINKVQFNDSKTQIVAMVSSLGEVVPLEPVTTTDKVEEWLTLLAEEMKASLTAQLSKCYSLRVKNSADFDYESFPSQVLDKADRIRFATDAEAALRGGGARARAGMLASLRALLEVYTSFDLTRHPVMQSKAGRHPRPRAPWTSCSTSRRRAARTSTTGRGTSSCATWPTTARASS